MSFARTPTARRAALLFFAVGFVFWILDFGGTADEVVGLTLMGSAAVLGVAAFMAAGPSAVTEWMRTHPMLVVLAIGFILVTIAAALVAPQE